MKNHGKIKGVYLKLLLSQLTIALDYQTLYPIDAYRNGMLTKLYDVRFLYFAYQQCLQKHKIQMKKNVEKFIVVYLQNCSYFNCY